MSRLAIVLPDQASSESVLYALSADGITVGANGSAALAALPRPAATEVVAVVPYARLSWHSVNLPKGLAANTPRLRAALEGLLEEQVLDEPQALHFALGPKGSGTAGTGAAKTGDKSGNDNGSSLVAVCERAWLLQALQTLEAAGLEVARVVPEIAPGVSPQPLRVVGSEDAPELVLANPHGVSRWPLSNSAAAALDVPLDTRREARQDTQQNPLPLLLAEPALAQRAEQTLGRAPQLESASQRALRACASDWDLAQFELQRSPRARWFKNLNAAWTALSGAPRWRALRWGLVALLVVNLVGLSAWAWRERSELQAKREAINKTLTATFPGVRAVIDAPAQMERELALLRQSAGAASARDFEPMLAALVRVLGPERPLLGLEYGDGELRARGLKLDAAQTQAISAQLRAYGYLAKPEGDALLISEGAKR